MTVNFDKHSYEKRLKIFIKAQSMLDQPFYLFCRKNEQGLILK